MIAIDTNILIYAFDTAYPRKRAVCKKLLEEVFAGRKKAVLTNQILAEFSAAVTRKIEKPLAKKDCQAIIGAFLSSENWKILNYTGDTVLGALSSEKPFWDSLIAQTLKENGIRELISENEKDFSGTGLIVRNPFTK
ncbi:MAG: hypothetical protein V1743_05790 [Nanoarchaeota archaeon]